MSYIIDDIRVNHWRGENTSQDTRKRSMRKLALTLANPMQCWLLDPQDAGLIIQNFLDGKDDLYEGCRQGVRQAVEEIEL